MSWTGRALKQQQRTKWDSTHYTASLDVDVLLAPGMTRPLATFLNGNTCSNCVFVIPTYEVITTHAYIM